MIPSSPPRGRVEPASDAVTLALVGIGAVLVWRLSGVLLLVFLAALIATMLRGLADTLAGRLNRSPQLMLAVVTIGLTAGGCAALYWIGPKIGGQAGDFYARLTDQLHVLRAQYGRTAVVHAVTAPLASPKGLEHKVATHAFTIVGITLATVADLFVVAVMSLYLAEAAGMYLDGAVRLAPPRYRTLVRSMLREMAHDLRWWLVGQLVDMATVGGLAAIGLSLLGVPAPFALAALAGLLTIVPYFGALAAAIPGVLVALTRGWADALWVILIFVSCHVIEGYVVAPLVQRRMVRLPPAVTIASMAVFAVLFGAPGIMLGTPLAVVAMVVVKRVYVERILDDGVSETAPTPAPGKAARPRSCQPI